LEHALNIPRVESIENLDRLTAEMVRSNKSSMIAGECSQIMGEEAVVENIEQMKISMPEEKIKKLNMSNNITKPTITQNGLTSSINQAPNNKKGEGLASNDLKCSQKTFKS
jgi:VIT1/CCC1 family predicted Fe2+/Mn2+ transporter